MRYTIFNSPVTSWTTSKLGTPPFGGSIQSGDYSFVRRCSSPELTHRVCERYSKLNEPGNADFYSILAFASNTGARKRERKVQVTHAQLCTFATAVHCVQSHRKRRRLTLRRTVCNIIVLHRAIKARHSHTSALVLTLRKKHILQSCRCR